MAGGPGLEAMGGFIFDARAALRQIQEQAPATIATIATKATHVTETSHILQAPDAAAEGHPPVDLDTFEERAAIAEHDGDGLLSSQGGRDARPPH